MSVIEEALLVPIKPLPRQRRLARLHTINISVCPQATSGPPDNPFERPLTALGPSNGVRVDCGRHDKPISRAVRAVPLDAVVDEADVVAEFMGDGEDGRVKGARFDYGAAEAGLAHPGDEGEAVDRVKALLADQSEEVTAGQKHRVRPGGCALEGAQAHKPNI